MLIDDDLAIPAFLKLTAPAKKFRAPRWKKVAAEERPDGDVWEKATRWEFFNDPRAGGFDKLPFGLYRYWVVEGRRWCRLASRGDKVKVAMRDWLALKATAKEIL